MGPETEHLAELIADSANITMVVTRATDNMHPHLILRIAPLS